MEQSRVVLNLLNSVERDGQQSQRRRATEFGIAVGLVNAYLKYCVKKGYIKVRRVPMRRYSYYLTPSGFAEKSRLTIMYLSNSLAFFRQARMDCSAVFDELMARGWRSVVLVGASEVAEIAALCVFERGMRIVGVVDASRDKARFMDCPVFASFDAVGGGYDCAVVTAINNAPEIYAEAVERLGSERVAAPPFLEATCTTGRAAQ